MKIVFFGTSSFAARVFLSLIESGVEIAAVITRPDRPRGRNLSPSFPPVKEAIVQAAPELLLLQPERVSTLEHEKVLKSLNADLFVVVAYGEIIKQNILDIPRLGCVNIHASLLPKYRGAAPIHRCLMAGERETGITIIEMSAQMDAGDILKMESLPILGEDTFGDLEPKLCALGSKLILEVIGDFERGVVVKIPQDHTLATFAPKLTPDDEVIVWDRPATEIYNQIRALSPFPCAWCHLYVGAELKRLKIKRASLNLEIKAPAGEIVKLDQQGWAVACATGGLNLLEVQLEGKKAMPIQDFVKGIRQSLRFKK
jgi:methionyl-tRNA formyltransferase